MEANCASTGSLAIHPPDGPADATTETRGCAAAAVWRPFSDAAALQMPRWLNGRRVHCVMVDGVRVFADDDGNACTDGIPEATPSTDVRPMTAIADFLESFMAALLYVNRPLPRRPHGNHRGEKVTSLR
ncbi:MAG: hypothetical protein ACM338_12555 [Betaproteobacteria bacterium]